MPVGPVIKASRPSTCSRSDNHRPRRHRYERMSRTPIRGLTPQLTRQTFASPHPKLAAPIKCFRLIVEGRNVGLGMSPALREGASGPARTGCGPGAPNLMTWSAGSQRFAAARTGLRDCYKKSARVDGENRKSPRRIVFQRATSHDPIPAHRFPVSWCVTIVLTAWRI